MSGPTPRRTARMLVSVPPILFGSIGVSGCTAKVVLDFFVGGGAAPFDQAAQHGPGAGHHSGGEVAQLLLARAGFPGVEEAGRELRGQGDGQVPDAGVIGGAGGRGEAEAGASVDDQAGAGGAACFLTSALMRSCQRADSALQALREVGAGPADLVLHVPLHGGLRDAEGVGDGARAFELLDRVRICAPADLGMGRVNAL